METDNTPKHTPTPWILDPAPDANNHFTIRVNDDSENGNTYEQPIATVYDEEHAAFIVKACNNHQQLINSITDVFNHLKDPAFKSDDLNRIYCIGILETALKASE